jgi:hypothetical protein
MRKYLLVPKMVLSLYSKAGGNWVTTAKNKMNTSAIAIEKILDNAFIIKRKSTKHLNEFSFNQFERPITHLDFFQLLANSNINLSSSNCTQYMCHIKATDYVQNWRSEIKLVVSSAFAQIVIKNAEWLNIYLDRSKFIEMFNFFQDQSLFHTDFGVLNHSENYYK